MKKIVLLFTISILFVSCKDKDIQDTITPKTQLVTKISSEKEEWTFQYDTELRMSEARFATIYSALKIKFMYDSDGRVESAVTSYIGNTQEDRRSFEYDAEGRLSKVSSRFFDGSMELEPVITLVDYMTDGVLWVHAPDDTEIAGTYFKYEQGNMKRIMCFDCPTSSFDHGYTEMDNFLPDGLRGYWKLYSGNQTIKFLTIYSLGSEKLVNKYFDFGPGYLPMAMENAYETDPESGKILKVYSTLTKGYAIPSNMQIGDTLATYEFTYSEF